MASARLCGWRDRAQEGCAAASRQLTGRLSPSGILSVPSRAWPTQHPALHLWSPLPASSRFRRWLPVDPEAPLVALHVQSATTRDAASGFTVDEVIGVLSTWVDRFRLPSHRLCPVPVLLAEECLTPDLRSALRRDAPSRRPAVVVVPWPPQAQRSVLYNALSAALLPGSAPASGGMDRTPWLDEIQASGVPVLTAPFEMAAGDLEPTPWTEPELLEASARASRLAAVDAAGRTEPIDQLANSAAAPVGGTRGTVVSEPRRVVIAGHDLKFAGSLIDHLERAGHEVRVDPWAGHQRHDVERSRTLAAWADAVLCEWTLGNAVWYSRHAPKRVRLTTRLHLQEAALPFPGQVRQERIDRFVFIADQVRRQVVRDHAIDPARTTVIPNLVQVPDVTELQTEGAAERAFVLGMVGILPARKGLHRALDLVSELRRQDPRFVLRVKGRLPQDQDWMGSRPQEQSYYREQFRRVEQDPLLAGAVRLDGFGTDMDSWYQQVGYALSVSDFESFHFTLPDGAVHGAVPVSLAWPGADELYPRHWLHADVQGMAQQILRLSQDEARRADRASQARAWIIDRYDAQRVLPVLAAEVLGG